MDNIKRTLPQPSFVKRAKTEHCDVKLDSPLLKGVERIRLPPSVRVNRLSSQHLEQLASQRTDILHKQGRRVVGLPLVFDDGIVLNWVRHKPGSIHSRDSVPSVHQAITSSTEHKHEEFRPLIPPDRSSGTSAADAIIIDSDEDVRAVSSHSSTVLPSAPPTGRIMPSDRDVVDDSDSDTESRPSLCIENEGENNQGDSHNSSPLPPARGLPCLKDVAELMRAPPSRALIREKRSEPRSDETSETSSDSEANGTDQAASEVEAIDNNKISVPHLKPRLPSSQPTRNSLVGKKRRVKPQCNTQSRATAVALQASRRKKFPEETPAHSSCSTREKSDFQAPDPQPKRVPLPKTDYGRARRLLMPDSADLPLVAVTMRGDCHFIERKKKYRITRYSLPNPGIFRHVTDVCMVGNTVVLGCDKGTNQISFLSVVGKPQMIDVACSPHSNGPRYQDTQRRGVSCLAAIHAKDGHIKFLSGGYDGMVHEWMADVENLDEPRFEKVVSHGACITALAYRGHDRSVVAAVQKTLHITDLNRQRTKDYAFSNEIQQVHIHPQDGYVTLLEVRHLDHQIQLYDSRKGGFGSEPCLSFGYRSTNSKFAGAHTRGSVHLVHFAKANEDGCVLLWDFRNCKRVVERRFQQAESVVHTIFADRDIATFGRGVVTFFEDYLCT